MLFIFYAIHPLQIEKLEAVNKYEKEVDHVTRLKAEKDQMNEELKSLRTLEIQRDRDREAERLSDKKATREADREKEEYRMKLVRFSKLFPCYLLIIFANILDPDQNRQIVGPDLDPNRRSGFNHLTI